MNKMKITIKFKHYDSPIYPCSAVAYQDVSSWPWLCAVAATWEQAEDDLNPPAFPVTHVKTIAEFRDREIERDLEGQRGMTLRDYFAAAALIGCGAAGAHPDIDPRIKPEVTMRARFCYEMADAMLKERSE